MVYPRDYITTWEFIPTKRDQQNVTPFGQNTTAPIFNMTSYAGDMPYNLTVRFNQTLNATCANITGSWNNSRFNNTFVKINTTGYSIANWTQVASAQSTGLWMWLDLNLTTNTGDSKSVCIARWWAFDIEIDACCEKCSFCK
jgi:hypothetical protein